MIGFYTQYDQDAGAIYLRLKKHKIARTFELSETVLVDLDDQRKVIGVEFLDPSEMAPFVEQFFPHLDRLEAEIANRAAA